MSFVSGTDCEGGQGTVRVKGAGKQSSNKKQLEYDIAFDTSLMFYPGLCIGNIHHVARAERERRTVNADK